MEGPRRDSSSIANLWKEVTHEPKQFPSGKDPVCTRVMRIAGVILLISVVSITLVTLIIKYPAASQTMYAVFGTAGAASVIFIALKYWSRQSKEEKTVTSSPTTVSQSKVESPAPYPQEKIPDFEGVK